MWSLCVSEKKKHLTECDAEMRTRKAINCNSTSARMRKRHGGIRNACNTRETVTVPSVEVEFSMHYTRKR
jgi:hypothetical protein